MPPPAPETPAGAAAAAGREPAAGRVVGRFEHGPYAAKLCNACHDSQSTNNLVAPGDRLCGRCHELALDRKYVHGPVASGGCRVCHEPHSSPNRYLLVSASDGFCLHCHDRRDLSATDGHGGERTDCTSCHDAHQSDRRYLLK